MKIIVIGGGNIAHSLAAAITRHEDVALLTRRPREWGSRVNDSPFLVKATDNLAYVADAEIIFIALPSFALKEMLNKIDPYLHTGQSICFTPANVYIPEFVESYGKRGIDIVCIQRVPYISRVEEYGHKVKMSSPRAIHKLYVSRESQRDKWTQICYTYFEGGVEFLHSPLTFIFNNSNPILHPARLVVLFKDWQKKIYHYNPPFYGEWTDESSELYIKADEEMYNVVKVSDSTGACEKDYESVLAHYGVTSTEEMTAKLRSIESFKSILSPMNKLSNGTWVPDFSSRYFTEDILGTRAIQSLAIKYGVTVPIIDGFVTQVENFIVK